MKTLKDVYIKVTDRNQEELETVLGMKVPNNYIVSFTFDSIYSVYMHDREINKQKVSLSQLKRLIETIPTREEITRLKRQISAYKTNYDKVVNHSLSKEEVITNVLTHNEWLQDKLEESVKKQNLLQNLYDDALKEIEKLKDTKDAIQKSKYLWQDESERLRKENERLKNKKWYQIWK